MPERDSHVITEDMATLKAEVKALRHANLADRISKVEVKLEAVEKGMNTLFQKGDKRDEADKIYRNEVGANSQSIDSLTEGVNKKASKQEVADLKTYVRWLLGGLVASVLLWIVKFGFLTT